MDWIRIVGGLKVSLLIALSSTMLSIIFGTILLKARLSKNKVLSVITDVFCEMVYGIPILLLLLALYYSLTIFNAVGIAIVVLSLIGTVEITKLGYDLFESKRIHPYVRNVIKVTSIVAIKEFARLVNYTTLVSVLGIVEFYRVSKMIAANSGPRFISIFTVAIAIYIVIHMVCVGVYRILLRKVL